jgi:hypothetical protein
LNKVILSKENLLQPKPSTSLPLFSQRDLDLSESLNDLRVFRQPFAEISEAVDRLHIPVLRRQPTRRFLDCKQAERHKKTGLCKQYKESLQFRKYEISTTMVTMIGNKPVIRLRMALGESSNT